MVHPESEPRTVDVALRPAHPADAPLLARWRREPSVRRFQPLTDVSIAQLRSELANQRGGDLHSGRGDRFQWLVLADGEPCGWITLVVTNWEHGLAELGYALSTAYHRRGIMGVALEQLVADLFLRTSVERLEARCAVDNDASRAVLEKIGFRREGRLKGYFVLADQRVDNWLYALLRSDWMP